MGKQLYCFLTKCQVPVHCTAAGTCIPQNHSQSIRRKAIFDIPVAVTNVLCSMYNSTAVLAVMALLSQVLCFSLRRVHRALCCNVTLRMIP